MRAKIVNQSSDFNRPIVSEKTKDTLTRRVIVTKFGKSGVKMNSGFRLKLQIEMPAQLISQSGLRPNIITQD